MKVVLNKATVSAYLTAAEERSEFVNRHHGKNALKSESFKSTYDDLCQKEEEKALDLYAESGENISHFSACCAIKIITFPHLNYDFRSSDECLFKQPCSCGTSVLLNRIKSNYNYFRDKVGRENYRTASEIDLDEEEEG